MQSKLVTEKINELIDLAKTEGDVNAQIVLLILSGARNSDDDILLSKHLQEFAKNVLIPRVNEKRSAAQN